MTPYSGPAPKDPGSRFTLAPSNPSQTQAAAWVPCTQAPSQHQSQAGSCRVGCQAHFHGPWHPTYLHGPRIQGPPTWTQAPAPSQWTQAAGLSTCWPRHQTGPPEDSSTKPSHGHHHMAHPESLARLTTEGFPCWSHSVKTASSDVQIPTQVHKDHK